MIKFLNPFLFLSFFSFGQATTSPQKGELKTSPMQTEWKTLDHADYALQYPTDWEVNNSGAMGTSFILFAPLESEQDKFKENVNLIVQDLKGMAIDLDKYTEISEGQVKTMLTKSVIIESKRIKNDSSEYHKLSYTAEQGVFKLSFIQYYWLVKEKAYILTFTAEQDKFTTFKETGEKILNSFIFKY
jgi:PsbP-like protein